MDVFHSQERKRIAAKYTDGTWPPTQLWAFWSYPTSKWSCLWSVVRIYAQVINNNYFIPQVTWGGVVNERRHLKHMQWGILRAQLQWKVKMKKNCCTLIKSSWIYYEKKHLSTMVKACYVWRISQVWHPMKITLFQRFLTRVEKEWRTCAKQLEGTWRSSNP